MQLKHFNRIVQYGVTAFFFISVALITYTLISEHKSIRLLYTAFPIAMLVAYFSPHRRLKIIASLVSLFLIFGGSIIEPLEMDAIEESLLVLPLCYIILFPGSLWPIAVGLGLIGSYLIDLPTEEFDEFVEDAIEVLFITIFATVMTFYQQKAKKQSRLYKRASLTDYLTNLPNRKSFFQAVSDLSASDQMDYAAIQVGLNNLKKVNDDLGYGYGDELLYQFACHIKRLVGGHGKLFRLGGDELIILVACQNGELDEVNKLIDRLEAHHDTVCKIHNTSHRLRYRGGCALLSDAQNNIKVWGKNVDAAVARGKQNESIRVQWYDDELMDETIRAHQIEIELKGAIDNQQLFLVYQPKVDLESNKIVGAEALIRWQHPDLGLVAPNDFIGVAERTAQIIPIGRWVFERAIIQAKAWLDKGSRIPISINVSSVQFAHDDIFPYIMEQLEKHKLPANCLQIEITETAMMDKHSQVAQTCKKLQDLGVTIAIDDFGVAYSSLNYLKHLPIDVVKIDKSFIDDCVEDVTDHMIVRTIIQMGHNLNKTVIAEGVEVDEQLELLRREKCHQYQGYLFSKPISAAEFNQLLIQ
ncbi:putative bifunctional diguanylate cyclase/phosphodiesterase [Vibrio sp. TRT 29B02]|uniref:putative bifunctional diguanylate cyclase/phosphodiesterase n=1 Tax=unclassified Vibrio TaxID=2614977 RepID=UPI003CE7D680